MWGRQQHTTVQHAGALFMSHLEVKEPPLVYFMAIDQGSLQTPGDGRTAFRRFAVGDACGATGGKRSSPALSSPKPKLAP